MNRSLPFAVLAGASLFSATAALAVSPQAKPAAAAHRPTAPAGKARMVTAKLANGKTVTYNCSLPGNASKQACK